MNTLNTILALIFLPSAIVGGITFILKKLFEQGLSRDIEKYKANLQAEFELSKMRFENEFQTKLFEFQTKFSLYHQKQAEVIGELYGMLYEAVANVSALISPLQFNDGRPQSEKIEETLEKCRILQEFFMKHRIYLTEDTCGKLDSVIQNMHKALIGFRVSEMEPRNPRGDTGMRNEAWKVISEEVPPIQKTLEREFRANLSAAGNDAQQLIQRERNQLGFHSIV